MYHTISCCFSLFFLYHLIDKKICSGYSRVGPVFRYPRAWQGHLGSGFAWSQVPRLASNSEPCAVESRPHTLGEIFCLTALAETSWFRNPGCLWLEEKSKKATQPRKYGRNQFRLVVQWSRKCDPRANKRQIPNMALSDQWEARYSTVNNVRIYRPPSLSFDPWNFILFIF